MFQFSISKSKSILFYIYSVVFLFLKSDFIFYCNCLLKSRIFIFGEITSLKKLFLSLLTFIVTSAFTKLLRTSKCIFSSFENRFYLCFWFLFFLMKYKIWNTKEIITVQRQKTVLKKIMSVVVLEVNFNFVSVSA